jgi:hypothetical protein
MKNFLNARCRSRVLAILFGLGCTASVLAEPLPFAGRWLLDDQDAQAAYTILTIKAGSLTWSGPNKSRPGCVQAFSLKKEVPGTVYVNGRGTRFVAGAPGSLPTYLLKLGAGTCDSLNDEVRISFPLVYDSRHMELIEYLNGKPLASRRFRKK